MGDESGIQESLGVKPEVYKALQKLRRALEISNTDKKQQHYSDVQELYNASRPKREYTKPDSVPLSRIYTQDLRQTNRTDIHEQRETSENVGCSAFCIKNDTTRQTTRNKPSETTRAKQPAPLTTKTVTPTSSPKVLLWDADTMLKMETCLCYIETYGMETAGIFGVSGSSVDIERIRSQSAEEDIPPTIDIHAVSGFVKTVLREANQPLIPRKAYEAWSIMAASKPVGSRQIPADSVLPRSKENAQDVDGDAGQANTFSRSDIWSSLGVSNTSTFRQTDLATVLSFIPDFGRAFVLARLSLTLGRIAAHCHQNRMNAHNLALVLAPAMTQWDASSVTALIELGKMTSLVESMIKDAKDNDAALKCLFEEIKK
ncbi:hypothetical protein GAYE_SCF06G2708 [Galdieria yellowstonensis]|uniref:Rho-GAP domain-containing protein n=1 Tax=Galdieria yellowstonensis TaxID=3028027 RepID=A0AAV9IBG6_9RHOD|nr:hypothetical protein GAYE_SCF06G2708 [Galdieria yellowstonensis]